MKSSIKKQLDSQVQEAVFMKQIVDSYDKVLFENTQTKQLKNENFGRVQKKSEKKRLSRKAIAPKFVGKNQQQLFIKNYQQSDNKKSQEQNIFYPDKNSPTIKGISSGFGLIDDDQLFYQKNSDSPNNELFAQGKNSSQNSISNNHKKKRKLPISNSRNNQILQSNSGLMSSGTPESLQRTKLPNEISSIIFQSQFSRSKQSLKNKDKRSQLNQSEYYDSEEESESEYYDDEESHSKIGPHNFSKYRLTEVKSQSINDYSVDGQSIEQLPFQNSISPNQGLRNAFGEKNTDRKQEFYKMSQQSKREQLSNKKYFKNQDQYQNPQNFVSELDMQFELLQQKTEIIKFQNESMKKLKVQKNLGLSKRSENTRDNLIQPRKFKKSIHEAMTPKSVSHGLSNILQFQLKNSNKQQSETNSNIKNLNVIQKEESKDLKNNLNVENSISISKNYSSTGGTPFSKYTACDQIPQNQYNNNNSRNIQNYGQKISDPISRQPSYIIQQDRISTGSQDNFGKLCDRIAQQNIMNPNDSQDRIGTETTNIIQQQYLLGYETNSEIGEFQPKQLVQISGEINMSQKISKNNNSGGTLTSKTNFIFMENRVDETTNRKQINFSEAESYQQKQRQTTLKRTKLDKMFITSNEKKGHRKSMQVDSKEAYLSSREKQAIPKNQLLSPSSFQGIIKKQKKSQLVQKARKQEQLDNVSNDVNYLMKPENILIQKADAKIVRNDDQPSPSHSMSSHFSNSSSTFLDKHTELKSQSVSQKKGEKKQINQYIITSQIGQSSYSKVKNVIN